MKRMTIILTLTIAVCACSCGMKNVTQIGEDISVFPDYKGVTIPSNIAPMNFEVTAPVADSDVRVVVRAHDCDHVIRAKGNLVDFKRRFWSRLLEENKGEDISITVCTRTDGRWRAYNPFTIHVAEEEMDPYLAYRLIPPGYSLWREMGLYQRNLENYDQDLIYSNLQGGGNCVNCHSFQNREPDKMVFHLRSEYAGTYLIDGDEIEKLNTKTDSTISALVYPSWHPQKNLVAFSVNKTNQVMHVRNENRIEVFDEASDVVVYDVENHEIVAADKLMSADSYETFPTFSPDGRSLYFCSAVAVEEMPKDFREVRYSLCRIDFNPETLTYGSKVDTLYNAVAEGRSASFPRVSPDGKYLAFVISDYGNFSIWHKDADLYCVDLGSGTVKPMSDANSGDVESYHSWSSNSRWMVFSSRRDDGLYTKPYFSYIDEYGNAHKPFLMPQKNPRTYYDAQLYSYNIPEFINGKVTANGNDISAFAKTDAGIQIGFRKD